MNFVLPSLCNSILDDAEEQLKEILDLEDEGELRKLLKMTGSEIGRAHV